jgi:hypothetical protein
VSYDDGRIACTDDELILRNYPGLFLGAKHIGYHEILEVHDVPNRWKMRISGSGDFVHYLNWDPHRRRKDRALVIDLKPKHGAEDMSSALQTPGEKARLVKPVITPDDPDQVIAELTAHGVTVLNEEGSPDGQ